MKEILNWFRENDYYIYMHILEVFVVVFASFTASTTMLNFSKRKRADKHLAKLLELEINHLNDRFIELSIDYGKQIKIINLKEDDSNDYEIKTYEIKKKLIDQELELLKFELVKKQFTLLLAKLKYQERKKVLEALEQPNIYGQINYLNSILKQCGTPNNLMIQSKN